MEYTYTSPLAPLELTMSGTKRVILWSAQRCLSTAFERSIRNLENSKVLHESLQKSIAARSATTGEQLVSSPVTPESALAVVTKDYEGVDVVFSKESMAFLVGGNFDILTQGRFQEVQHSFLIRNPEKSLESLYHCSLRPATTEQDYVSPEHAGFRELSELIAFVRENLEPFPVVVDADDLLDDPEGIMRSYCSAMGLKFKEGMTKWSPGPVADFECLWSLHDNVFNSSGISRKETRNYATEGRALPAEWSEAIANLMPCYQEMRKYRIAPSQTRSVQTAADCRG